MQLVRSYLHVLVLHDFGHGTQVSKVPLVEAVDDYPADGPVRRHHDSRAPAGMIL